MQSFCRRKLNAIEYVINATVNLEKNEAVINMSQHISTKDLQNALPEKYTVSYKDETNTFETSISIIEEKKSELKQLFPLFLIFIFIISASILLNYKLKDVSGFMIDFMAYFM